MIVVEKEKDEMMEKMEKGIEDDMESEVMLERKVKMMIEKEMKKEMWENKEKRRKSLKIEKDGVRLIGKEKGEMEERGEDGNGRMREKMEIVEEIENMI